MRYVFGDYTLDTDRYELRCAGTPVSLGPKPFALLAYLLQHRNRAVAQADLACLRQFRAGARSGTGLGGAADGLLYAQPPGDQQGGVTPQRRV